MILLTKRINHQRWLLSLSRTRIKIIQEEEPNKTSLYTTYILTEKEMFKAHRDPRPFVLNMKLAKAEE